MLHSRSNGQSIVDYIPPHLRNMFFNNPAAIHASQNGLDPYGFSTDGLVLYLPLWALKDSAFKSVDAYKPIATVTAGATWTPNGRDFNSATPGYMEIPASFTQLDFTSEDFSMVARIKVDDLSAVRYVLARGLTNVDGYYWAVWTDGKVGFKMNQAGGGQLSYSSDSAIVTATWYTIGISRSEASVRIYISGVDDTAVVGSHTNPVTCARTMKIGVDDTKTTYPYDGKIEFLMVYNRALSAGEHLDIHNRSKWGT